MLAEIALHRADALLNLLALQHCEGGGVRHDAGNGLNAPFPNVPVASTSIAVRFTFDPDALLAALAQREARPFNPDIVFTSTGRRP